MIATHSKCAVTARCNPFSVQKTTNIPYRFENADWDDNIERLQKLGYRGMIMGPRGTGKSTLLKSLKDQLNAREWNCHLLRLPHDSKDHVLQVNHAIDRYSNDSAILLVDGIERLGRWSRWKLVGCKNIVATAHRPFRLPGFKLPVWVKTSPTQKTLHFVLSELNLADDLHVIHRANELFDYHRGNIREVLRDLYDQKAAGQL